MAIAYNRHMTNQHAAEAVPEFIEIETSDFYEVPGVDNDDEDEDPTARAE